MLFSVPLFLKNYLKCTKNSKAKKNLKIKETNIITFIEIFKNFPFSQISIDSSDKIIRKSTF
ncbi:hypothetical protein KUTeg_016357 [Tegillarca granosa]|uniref:Uncharacterized protein n=1 Tax=Tegillarca granosa TaxID=220873 RepID=A0ABQ9EKM5_TEGGR|nr:hypothetical protein KUTeg_016357 [Tegillarca granosa]